jgi:ribosomal protein S15P/S13E
MAQKINKDKTIREALVIFSAGVRIFKPGPKTSIDIVSAVLKDIRQEFNVDACAAFFRGFWNRFPSRTPVGLAAVLMERARQITENSEHDPRDKEAARLLRDLVAHFSRMKAHCSVIDAQSPNIRTDKAVEALIAKNDEDEALRAMIRKGLRGRPGRPVQPGKNVRHRKNLHH